MKFLYHCNKCKKDQEVIKSKKEESQKEKCFCGWELSRKITAPICKLVWWLER